MNALTNHFLRHLIKPVEQNRLSHTPQADRHDALPWAFRDGTA